MKQRGFYNLDFTGLFIGLVVFGLVVGFLLYPALGWLWDFIKPILHEATK